jgi:predicted transcriptional regulator
MELSKKELELISKITTEKKIIEIKGLLNLSSSQIYKIIEKLTKKEIVKLSNKKLFILEKTHINLLVKLITKFPNLIEILSGKGIEILSILNDFKTIKQILEEVKINRATLFKKLREFREINLVVKEKNKYKINEKIWGEVKDFILEINLYEKSIDKRIPFDSEIYYKNNESLIFSNDEEIKAELTAFSVYKNYGIKILLPTNFYCFQKKKPTKKEIFIHSLFVIEKNKDFNYIIFTCLFYLKFKKEFQEINSPILKDIKKILNGKIIEGFPLIYEIKEKAKIYNVKVEIKK